MAEDNLSKEKPKSKKKEEGGLFLKNIQLSSFMGVKHSVITQLKKKRILPVGTLTNIRDPKVLSIVRTYQAGFDYTGKPLPKQDLVKRYLNRNGTTSDKEKEEIKELSEKLMNEYIAKNPTLEIAPKGKVKKLDEDILKKLNTTTQKTLKKINVSDEEADLEKLSEQLTLDLAGDVPEAVRKMITQTLVGIEQYKKLKIENQKKKENLIEKDDVVYFFNKYFNSLNDTLLELPSVSLASKLLGEIQMLERRGNSRVIIERLIKDIKGKSEEEIKEIITKSCLEINSQVDDAEVKIKIQTILTDEITKKISQAYKAIKDKELFGGNSND